MNTKKITGTILLAAMLSGGGLAAAKASHNKAVKALQTEQDWAYTPSASNPDPTLPSNYTAVGSLNCPGGDDLCGINAPAVSGQPNLDKDANFKMRIQSLDESQGDVHSFN